ncbi:MAG TPA: DUF2846 domain-containing protein [Stellaceae bacterium]|nr:DUF2846 domain-containing protein [Stellaceae bacterium]
MRLMARRLVLLLALALAAGALSSCAAGPGPYPDLQPFAAVEANLPPPAPGLARIYFYRALSYYDLPEGTSVYLNQQTVGYSRIGTVFYRDVTPGSYFISVLSRGAYPNQFKTIQIKPGQSWYVRIESLASWSGDESPPDARGATFTVNLIDPAVAKQEIRNLSYLPPG